MANGHLAKWTVKIKPEIPGNWATPQQNSIFTDTLHWHTFGDGGIQTTNNMVIVSKGQVTWFLSSSKPSHWSGSTAVPTLWTLTDLFFRTALQNWNAEKVHLRETWTLLVQHKGVRKFQSDDGQRHHRRATGSGGTLTLTTFIVGSQWFLACKCSSNSHEDGGYVKEKTFIACYFFNHGTLTQQMTRQKLNEWV